MKRVGDTIRKLIYGLMLNLQFFSTLPVGNREIPITKEHLRKAIQLFPLLGMIQGGILSASYLLLNHWTFLSPLAIGMILWLMIILLTGGLHLDGWIDSSDALFSYRDREKRIDILADPRIGAFGLISAIVLLLVRFVLLYEVVQMGNSSTAALIFVVPVLGKSFMGFLISFTKPMKDQGLGKLFHESSDRSILTYYGFFIGSLLLYIAVFRQEWLPIFLCLIVVTALAYFLIKKKLTNWFGGVNGDTVGGATEGVELLLWLTIWLYHYSVMA